MSSFLMYSAEPSMQQLLPLAYVGPGAGLTMLGALALVLGILLLAILAPILIPLRMARDWFRKRRSGVRSQP